MMEQHKKLRLVLHDCGVGLEMAVDVGDRPIAGATCLLRRCTASLRRRRALVCARSKEGNPPPAAEPSPRERSWDRMPQWHVLQGSKGGGRQ